MTKTLMKEKIPGEYDVKLLGLNYRLDEIEQIGITQLKKIDKFITLRKKIIFFWKNHKTSRPIQILKLNVIKNLKLVLLCINNFKKKLANKRFEIIKKLKNFGIGTNPLSKDC